MYDIYGIVKVETFSCNKGEYFLYLLVMLSFLIKGNLKMNIVYCGALDID